MKDVPEEIVTSVIEDNGRWRAVRFNRCPHGASFDRYLPFKWDTHTFTTREESIKSFLKREEEDRQKKLANIRSPKRVPKPKPPPKPRYVRKPVPIKLDPDIVDLPDPEKETPEVEYYVSRQDLAQRWGVTVGTIARYKKIKPVKLGKRMIRYKLSDIHKIERELRK